MTAATSTSVSLACSDITENTYVLLLEWRCRKGRCAAPPGAGPAPAGGERTLVKFTRGRGVTEQGGA